MNKDLPCSDEELNRFVDDELGDADKRRLERHLVTDSAFAEKVRQYRSIDQALRDAYDDVEPPQRRTITKRLRAGGGNRLALAILLFPLGALMGWFTHGNLTPLEVRGPLVGGISSATQDREYLNTVLHIDIDKQAAVEALLDRVETILTTYTDQEIQVEVVANAAGLNLLRSDKSAVAQRVSQMMDKYDNLMFLACANTIKHLREKGERVKLVGRTHASETAIEHIVNRLRDGWTYVKI
jgi:intracellular sulfur oxidation DsrE/DsrF family protein